MTAILHKFKYIYMNYELQLLEREIRSLFPYAIFSDTGKYIILNNIDLSDVPKLKRLTYIASFEINSVPYKTQQFELENCVTSINNHNKQSTRYSTHGLHEYKGKYNPQIVRAILNILDPNSISHKVIDPFCGSGTTMLECAHIGTPAVGTDINPFAVFLSNAKLHALGLDCNNARDLFNSIKAQLSIDCSHFISTTSADERITYLSSWIPKRELGILEGILSITKNLDIALSSFFQITASDLIRDYSNQEPSDLRIRRRKSPFPELPFLEAWEKNVFKYLDNISYIQQVCSGLTSTNKAINVDIKTIDAHFDEAPFDIAVTSPPYATALPYIDTQRISLVWLGLCNPKEIMELESSLIGSRELYKMQKKNIGEKASSNLSNLPSDIFQLIEEIRACIGPKDGFRKKAMPLLLYRYFTDMQDMFTSVFKVIKPNGHYCLVVGHNKTTINGKIFQIDTPNLLSMLATKCGWSVEELIPLQTYKRYGLHAKNSINHETLIILKKRSEV